MGNPFYLSRSSVEKIGALDRRARLESGVTVDRALARHLGRCPTASSLKGAAEVSWSADIVEV